MTEKDAWRREHLKHCPAHAGGKHIPELCDDEQGKSTDANVRESTLVARFWNEDGYEMPSLYRGADGRLVCTWNYLLLVAPDDAVGGEVPT